MNLVRLLQRAGHWYQDRLWRLRMTLSQQRARWQGPRLFNAARHCPATQSSTNGRKTNYAGRGTDGRVGAHSCFRTQRHDPHPWWIVELKADWPIHSIRIHPCRKLRAINPARLEVSLSADGQQWDIVHASCHLFGDRARFAPLTIRLLGTKGGRFVKLELPEGGQLSFNQVEVMVERRHRAMLRVAKRYNFKFERMTSLRMPPNAKPYSLRNVPSHFKGEIQALHVDNRQGRFGNNLRQIGTAVCVARQLGLQRVYLGKLPLLEIDRPITFGGVTIVPDSELQHDNPRGVLCGTFYYKSVFNTTFKGLGHRRVAAASRAIGQPLFHRLAAQPGFVPEATDLAIHLRAGDIFALKNPHPFYVQPPLAFYQVCIAFARVEIGVKRVILVYQDEGNPCIGALKSWLDEIGLPYVAQSSTLEQDLAVLMAARHCVFGRGSFGEAVALLSRNIRTLFFCWLDRRLGELRDVCDILTIGVEDIANGYIKGGDWRNTPEQRRMMLDYPPENLRLDRRGLLPEVGDVGEEPLVVAPQPQLQ
jgi:hypothetical protein